MTPAMPIVVLALAAVAAGFGAQTPAPKALPTTASVAGQVVDAGTGAAVPGAVVSLYGEPVGQNTRRTVADRNGRFSLNDVPPGLYQSLAANAPDYLGQYYGATTAGSVIPTLELKTGMRLTGLTIRLWKPATISGTVIDQLDKPLADVSVRVLSWVASGGVRRLRPVPGVNKVMTNSQGQYAIEGLKPGEYLVQAFSPPAYGVDRIPSVIPATFYPSGVTPSQAVRITLNGRDDKSHVDFQIAPVKAVRVSGQVVGPAGGIASATVHLLPAGLDEVFDATDFETARTVTGADGSFSLLGVPSGSYTLRILRIAQSRESPVAGGAFDGFFRIGCGVQTSLTKDESRGDALIAIPVSADPSWWADLPIAVGDIDVTDLHVVAQSGARISGRVEFDGMSPRPSPELMLRIGVGLDPADGTRSAAWSATAGRIESDGTFSSVGYPAGRYLLRLASLPVPWTLSAIRLGSQDVSDEPLVLQGADITGLAIVLTDHPNEVSGSVRPETGALDPQTSVIVFAVNERRWVDNGCNPRGLRSQHVSPSGTYAFNGMPAGDYYLAAVSDSKLDDWRTPAFLGTIIGRATRVVVRSDGKVVQDLRAPK